MAHALVYTRAEHFDFLRFMGDEWVLNQLCAPRAIAAIGDHDNRIDRGAAVVAEYRVGGLSDRFEQRGSPTVRFHRVNAFGEVVRFMGGAKWLQLAIRALPFAVLREPMG